MAYKEKDTKKWTAQWFEENALGEKSKHRKRGFDTKKEAPEHLSEYMVISETGKTR